MGGNTGRGVVSKEFISGRSTARTFEVGAIKLTLYTFYWLQILPLCYFLFNFKYYKVRAFA